MPMAISCSIAASDGKVEVIVMDDGSTDGTAEIVRAAMVRDDRLRLLSAPPLPAGWSGKMHACARLAEAARGTHLLFIDADVRLDLNGAKVAGLGRGRIAGLTMGVPHLQ